MSLSIQSTSSDGAQRALQRGRDRLERTMAHLATGKRIATASDDAAGLAIAQRLSAQVHGMAMGERNLADGQSLARTAEGALQSSHDAIGRMRELSIQAQNGTVSAADRATIQGEYDQLAAQLDQTARGTTFAGRNLLDGSASGAGAPVITDGSGGDTAIDIAAADAASLGVGGLDVGDPATLQALDAATAQVSASRSELGAVDTRFVHQSAALAVGRENAEAARSRIEDVDVAKEVATLTQERILQSLQLSGVKTGGHSHQRLLDLLA